MDKCAVSHQQLKVKLECPYPGLSLAKQRCECFGCNCCDPHAASMGSGISMSPLQLRAECAGVKHLVLGTQLASAESGHGSLSRKPLASLTSCLVDGMGSRVQSVTRHCLRQGRGLAQLVQNSNGQPQLHVGVT